MPGDNVYWIGQGELETSVLFAGITGRGKSVLLQRCAEDLSSALGISIEEAFERLKPTPQELAQRQNEIEKERQREARRMHAVKEAYWQNSEIEDFNRIHDCCSDIMGVSPTDGQIKKIYDVLPDDVIHLGMQFGFGDTEVGDDAYRFIEDNKALIKEILDA